MRKQISDVKAWQDTIVIPTYLLGPEDPNPPLLVRRRGLIHPGSRIVYPYALQEELSNRKEDKEWKIFHLENRYLHLGVLPELGGRLLFAYDKASGHEALHYNHVIKYARIGIRGAFFAGGIEWNFPNGHTATTSSPIDCAIRENDDGSVTLLLGDIERVSRMRWSVSITLTREHAFFETEMRLYNRTALPHRHWFWSNSSAPVSKGTQYITTAGKVSDLNAILDFPIHNGVDIGWDRNHPEPQDMFSLNHRGEFGAWYSHDLQRGMVNVADRTESRGLKFFTWGNSDDGGIWEGRLTDADGFYCEMQSGRFATQRLWGILSPCTQESWKETWYPFTSIGAPCFANRDLAVSFSAASASSRARIGVHATAEHKNARLSLLAGSKKVWEKRVDLAPSAPFLEEIDLKGVDDSTTDITMEAADSSGALLAHFVRHAGIEPQPPLTLPAHIEPRSGGACAEDCWHAGVDRERLGEPEEARRQYELALGHDAGYSPAQVSLAVMDLRQGQPGVAAQRLDRILATDPGNEEARFFLAAGLLAEERLTEAADHLRTLARSRTFRPGAAFLLGGILLGQGKALEAAAQLSKCVEEYPWHDDARSFLAHALRALGRDGEAAALVQEVLKRDPLNFPARAEAFLADKGSKPRLEETLRGEVQSWIELSCDYARFGLYREAYDLLGLCKTENPLVHYHLGYYAEKLGMAGAASHYEKGRKADPRYVFPHRLESERVLRRALEVFPEDGRAAYYLGNLLCSRDRAEEAISCWEAARGTVTGFSVLHRNLGRAYWKVRRDPDRAIAEYRTAIECAPGDYKLYLELDKILLSLGRDAERRALIDGIPPALHGNDLIAERMAACYADAGEFDRALQIITKTWFFPWEIYKGVRYLYVDAVIGGGIQLEKKGRHNEAIASYREAMSYSRNVGVGESRWKSNAEAWYRIGLAQEAAGDSTAARESWTRAAEEPRPVVDALCYYKAMALRRLGREGEAGSVMEELLKTALCNLEQKRGDGAENQYLAGLALKGKGDRSGAAMRFAEALKANRGHRRSRWEVDGFTD
jgi:tetratricopeptide (TPR) repeat protein